MTVSIIIPNWNGLKYLRTCLNSLRKQQFTDFETIIIDNGSTDGSVEYVKKYHKHMILVTLDHNSGFAAAVNLGIKLSKGKYILLLNNDTSVKSDAILKLVQILDDKPEIAMVASKMVNFYNRYLMDSAGDYIDVVGHAQNIGLGKSVNKYKTPGEVFLVTGGGSLYRKILFDQVGLLDEDFFAYFEDVDFGLRAQSQGFKAYYQPEAIIYHIHKGTSSRNKAFLEYLQFRNMTQTIIKNFPKELLLRDFNLIKIILVNLNTIRFLARSGYLLQAIQAELYIILHCKKLFEKRKKIQSEFKVDKHWFISQFKPKKITFFGLFKPGI